MRSYGLSVCLLATLLPTIPASAQVNRRQDWI